MVPLSLFANQEVSRIAATSELQEKGLKVNYQEILIDIKNRDQNDRSRSLAPLVKTEDAILIDSTDKKIEDVLYLMIREIDR